MQEQIKEQVQNAMDGLNGAFEDFDKQLKTLPPEKQEQFNEWNMKLKTALAKRDINDALKVMKEIQNFIPK